MIREPKRLSPTLVTALAALWLLLNPAVTPGQVLLGLALALLVAWFGSTLRPLQATLHRPDRLAVLALHVLRDIVQSNVAVAGIVLGLSGWRESHSGFVQLPLALRDPHGLALLAAIVTLTPGTVWAGLAPDGRSVSIHLLDARDADGWIRTIRQRYERPLMEIFE